MSLVMLTYFKGSLGGVFNGIVDLPLKITSVDDTFNSFPGNELPLDMSSIPAFETPSAVVFPINIPRNSDIFNSDLVDFDLTIDTIHPGLVYGDVSTPVPVVVEASQLHTIGGDGLTVPLLVEATDAPIQGTTIAGNFPYEYAVRGGSPTTSTGLHTVVGSQTLAGGYTTTTIPSNTEGYAKMLSCHVSGQDTFVGLTDAGLVNKPGLLHTGGSSGWGTCGGESVESIPANTDGYVEVLLEQPIASSYFMIGLNSDPSTNDSWTDLDFGVFVDGGNGVLQNYSNGAGPLAGNVAWGNSTVIRVERTGTTVSSYVNGVLWYTFSTGSTAELFVDFSIFNTGTYISQPKLSVNGGAEIDPTWTSLLNTATTISLIDYSYGTIEYCCYLDNINRMSAYFNGALEHLTFFQPRLGDELKIERDGSNNVHIKINDSIVYTFATPTTTALLCHVSTWTANTLLNAIEMSNSGASPTPVVWQALNNLTEINNTVNYNDMVSYTGLRKQLTLTNSWGDCGGYSSTTIPANTDGYVEFTTVRSSAGHDSSADFIIGMSPSGTVGVSNTDVKFGVTMGATPYADQVQSMYNGLHESINDYCFGGEVVRLERDGSTGTVSVYQNGTFIRDFSNTDTAELQIQYAARLVSNQVTDVKVSINGAAATSPSWSSNVGTEFNWKQALSSRC